MNRKPGLVIAVDGPSGVGKSSTATAVAKQLGLAYLDTGAMYRAVAVEAMRLGIIDDPDAAILLSAHADIVVNTAAQSASITINGTDVTNAIRDPEVSAQVSKIATNQPIRDLLTARMRRLIFSEQRIIAEGRDITTVVIPDADVRVLLLADAAVRVQRREAELAGRANHEQVVDQVVRRDREDSKVSEFSKPAPGVVLIDSTQLSLAEVVQRVIALVPQDALPEQITIPEETI
ncbi:MAG: (d)CMP kinase [Propionibacteriaceae bacterium]|jgi:cytidylate kinase|nr:(d)CMP kinase [Propionibacteriaceae bacterium]